MKKSKGYFKSNIISSILLFILGLLLFFKSEVTITLISYIIGTILISIGMVAIIRYIKNIKNSKNEIYDLNIIYGIVTIILGILVIKNKETLASIIPFVLGVCIIISGSSKLQYTLEIKKFSKNQWKIPFISSIISVTCGIILIFNPFKGALMITKIIGIFVGIYSILDIITTIAIKNNLKKSSSNNIKEAVIEEIEDNEENKKRR